MVSFLKMTVFSLAVIAAFALYSNLGIPVIVPAAPPVEEEFDLGAMTMEGFVALGERVVQGKGTCTLCHNPVGGRAPPLENVGAVVKQRLADPRYQGEADDVESYLRESLLEPSAFVVAGFGKAGSGDTVSPMPDASGGSIGLSEAETAAVIAHLQDASGLEITVEIPTDAAPAEEAEEEGEPREPLETVDEIIDAFACGACHKIGENEGDVGPDLRTIGAKLDRPALRRSILMPNAEIAEGFEPDQMPPDYGAQLYAGELEMLLDHLSGLK